MRKATQGSEKRADLKKNRARKRVRLSAQRLMKFDLEGSVPEIVLAPRAAPILRRGDYDREVLREGSSPKRRFAEEVVIQEGSSSKKSSPTRN